MGAKIGWAGRVAGRVCVAWVLGLGKGERVSLWRRRCAGTADP